MSLINLLEDEIEYLLINTTFELDINKTIAFLYFDIKNDILFDMSEKDITEFIDYTKINPEEQICIKLDFNDYLKNKKCKIMIDKSSNLGVLTKQITTILENYIGNNYKTYITQFKNKTYSYENENENSFIFNLIELLILKIKNFSIYCSCCDIKLDYPVFIRSVCENELCKYQSIELGIDKNLLDIIKYDFDKLNLFITLTYSTCKYKPDYLIPYPELLYLDNDSDINKMGTYIYQCINKCPNLKELQKIENEIELHKILNSLCKDLYLLLKWIYNSNRSYLKNVDITNPDNLDNDLKTIIESNLSSIRQIYKINTNSPIKENEFKTLQKQHGETKLLFHGSKIINWHSILRKNLINYSNTTRMANGAVFGSGIYLSSCFQTSYQYSCYSQYNTLITKIENSKDSTVKKEENLFINYLNCGKFNIMAIVEAIDNKTEEFKKTTHYVVSNEKLLALRYLIILK